MTRYALPHLRKTHGNIICAGSAAGINGEPGATIYGGTKGFLHAFAAGKILNPKTARSQLLGGIVWGISLALLEATVRDARDARVVTKELQDYHVPVNADVPAIDVIMVDEVDPVVSAVGAKGIGEVGIVGVAAAVANAVYHATGKRVRDLPITLDKLLTV